MAGNRLEKLGTIFTRINGLIRGGALNHAERPLWYDIYESFPPKEEPVYDRPISDKPIRQILYYEDLVRSRFYKEFGSPGIVDMMDKSSVSIGEKFVNHYNEIRGGIASEDDAFDQTVRALRAQGIVLETLEEKAKKETELLKKSLSESRESTVTDKTVRVSVQDLFRTSKANDGDDDTDFVDDEPNQR